MYATNYVTQEQRNQIVKEYFFSGLTRKEFCQQKEISVSSFYRWKMDDKDEQTGDLQFIPLVKPICEKISMDYVSWYSIIFL